MTLSECYIGGIRESIAGLEVSVMYEEYEILSLGQQLKKLLEKKSLPIMQMYDLRKVELDILSFFSMQEREGDTAKDIMRTKRISKAHVSKSVDNLKRRGYISLEEDKKDHRRIHIFLTQEGHQVLAEFTEVRKQCKEILFRNITKEEMQVMMRVMEKMQQNVNEELDET